MTDKRIQAEHGQSNMEKDPADWVTGDEPMTGAQKSYLKTLCEEARQPFDETLSKAEASRRIDELQTRAPPRRSARRSPPRSPTRPSGASSASSAAPGGPGRPVRACRSGLGPHSGVHAAP
jgi:Protein of unknown function (DUF3072)